MGKRAYQLKATILETKPPIWRRVVVPEDTTLDRLHEILQAAFGWRNYHLHEFEIDGVRYGIDDGECWGDPPRDERKARLRNLVEEGSSFLYLYDSGDDWRHKVVVEKIQPPETAGASPACIGGRRACPPEDCGGPWGYQSFLEAIRDPAHDDHERMLEWVGGSFDPEAFDPGDFQDHLNLGRLATF